MDKYLQDALNSAVNQTYKNIEIICIDDCSTDNSLKILNEYAAKDKRIKVFHLEKNRGTGFARNYGLQKAKGTYIMFLDPDDYYEHNTCETALNQISKYKNDFVMFNNYIYYELTNEKKLQNRIHIIDASISDRNNITAEQAPECLIRVYSIWNKIFRKKFLEKNNITFTETTSGEDQPFAILCFLKAKS